MERLLKLAQQESDKSPDDIDAAVDRTITRANRTAWFGDLAGELIARAVRNAIHDYRHGQNVQMRRDTRQYGGPAVVTAGEAVGRVAGSLYLYMIDGRSLGSIRGDELSTIADAEGERATGHKFNAKLCRELAPLVKEGQTVRQCVKEAKLQTIFEELG